MKKIVIEKVRKEFGELVAVDGLDLGVEEGEFMSLLGPSGCGKTTTLNMIMGYEKPTCGKVYIDGKVANDVPVGKRGVGMVFQDYAIFLHMTVFENLAFALRVRKVPDDQVKAEVEKMALILGLSALLQEPAGNRNMSELQRIAIGRSLMVQASILLLDEPLSNLDADMRAKMRGELKKFQLELDQTMIYVTHDQVEAMSLSDRIAVMDFGSLQQLDTPYEIYNHPVNVFVATFIGSPPMNLIEGEIRTVGDRMVFKNPSIQCDLTAYKTQLEKKLRSRVILFGIRPEHVEVLASKDKGLVDGTVCELEPMGSDVATVLECNHERIMALTKPEHVPEIGVTRAVNFNLTKMHLFDKESGARIDVRLDS